MKKVLKLSTLIAMAVMMSLAALSPATAQTPATDPVEELDRIASDVTIYGRSYEADTTATQPAAGDEMSVMAIIQAYEFDDADTAAEAFPHVEQLMKDELEPSIGAELETEEVGDLGDTASLSTAEIEQSGQSISLALLMVQQDNMIYLSAGVSMNASSDDLANDFMTFMLDGEAGDADAVEFMEDGTSTGGYFDVFPTDEDTEIVQGLMVSEDMYETTN